MANEQTLELSCPCCCTAGNSCSNCTDTTPATMDVTFSGVTLCTGCRTAPTATFEIAWNTGYSDAWLNSTHTLTQVGSGSNACIWQKVETDAVTRDLNCNGGPAARDLTISLTRTPTGWDLYVGNVLLIYAFYFGVMFSDTAAEVDNTCTLPASWTNQITCDSEATGEVGIASGGSATVVCG